MTQVSVIRRNDAVRVTAVLLLPVLFCAPVARGQFVQQGGKLIGAGTLGIANQGQSLSVSGDGTTAIVGGPYDSSGIGASWVFIRENGAWVQQGPKLVGEGAVNGTNGARQGASVALSSDGNTAIVGGTGDNGGSGAAWIFTRSNGAWTQQGSKLVGTGAVDGFIGARQGQSVSLSSDGNTAMIGGPLDSSGSGACWVFTRAGGTWTQMGGKIVAATASGQALQGWSVSLSGDGNTAMEGGIYDFNNAGAAWIFVRSNGSWIQQGFKLYGLDAGEGANQGWSVALSSDGNTAIMGGMEDLGGTGAVWVFTRTNGVWSQQGGKIVGTGARGLAGQGAAVAISADGNTAVVGGPNDSLGLGASWIFTRDSGTWSQQGGKLIGAGAAYGDFGSNQGGAVALASDGSSLLAGGAADNAGTGAVWAFVRTGTTWTQQGPKFVGTGARGNASQGASVAISFDGNTAIAGGPNDSTGGGAAWVFTRTGGAWTQQGMKLEGTGGTGYANQGTSVSLSSDGTTAAIGGPGDSASTGATWVFTRSLSSWNQQGSKLVGSGNVNGTQGVHQGDSVSLSADGTTLIVGGPADSSGAGAAWIFARSSGLWSQQGGKLVGTGANGKAGEGTAVAVSADGNTAIVGGPSDSAGKGAAWIFTRNGGVWTQQGGKLTGSGATGGAGFGAAVSLSSDGNGALVGGPNDNSGEGAFWAFVRSGGGWSQQGNKVTGSGADQSAGFGGSVSLSGDGNTAVAGGAGNDGGIGAIWVFDRSGETWTQGGPGIVGSGGVGSSAGGRAVAVSGDGNSLIAGGPGDNSGSGASWVFVRNISGVSGGSAHAPRVFALEQNFPNPFNPSTTIRFSLPSQESLRLDVYNAIGEGVARLADGIFPAGVHSVRLESSHLASGVYICTLQAGGRRASVKMLLVR